MKTQTLAFLGLIAAAPIAAAQGTFPSKPIRIMVPFGAGSGSDIAARFFGEQLAGVIGQPAVIDNRPGANAIIGAMAVKNAPADGYTLLLGSWTTISVNPIGVKDLPYDPVKDFKPVSGLTRSHIALAVPAHSKLQKLPDFVAAAKGGKPLNVGTYSTGFHIVAEWIHGSLGAKATNVPYKASGQMYTDMMGSQIDGGVDGTTSLGPMVRSGKLRLLAVTGEQRHPEFPDVPTMRESGTEVVAYGWSSFFVRAETPDDVTQRLADAMVKVLNSTASRDYAKKNGSELMLLGPAAMRKFQLAEIERFRKVAQTAGIKPE
jgi:tripartite-type tricarboxylate transporter receptor subunit TctC